MNLKIRRAVPSDARPVMEIALQRKMRPRMEGQQQSGFLLDISLEQYLFFVDNDEVIVLEDKAGEMMGFSIVLGPETMRFTGIWDKAAQIRWGASSFVQLDPSACAYYEQIAVLPRYSRTIYPLYLALVSLQRTFKNYDYLFAGVVSFPLGNQAPLRLLKTAGWVKVGTIEERYPEYGRIGYDIYCLQRSEFAVKSQQPFLVGLLSRMGRVVDVKSGSLKPPGA